MNPKSAKASASSGITGWFRRCAFRGFYRVSGRAAIFDDVRRADELYRAPRESIEHETRKNLFRLLRHASKTVPYYRDLAVFATADITEDTATDCLKQVPILTKSIIRDQGDRLHSETPGEKVVWKSSGGSTGEPVRLLHDRGMRRCSTLNKLMFMRWLGFEPGELHLHIWGVPERKFDSSLSLRERIYRSVHNQVFLSCFKMSDEHLRFWLRWIQRHRPAVIEAYVDAIYHVSRAILRDGHKVPSPRGIIVGAGVLTPEMGETIERAFDCPVLDRYGSREVGDMACSCPSNRQLHVSEQMYQLEIVDDDGRPCKDGVEGNILVTLLTNLSMPLLRYQIEDRAAWASGPCACGRTTRRLAYVAGRQSDFLLASDGTKINGNGLIHLTFSTPGIYRFQYRQSSTDRVLLAVVPLDPKAIHVLERNLEEPMKQVRELLKGVDVQLSIVQEIAPSLSGKHRYVINDVVQDPAVVVT